MVSKQSKKRQIKAEYACYKKAINAVSHNNKLKSMVCKLKEKMLEMQKETGVTAYRSQTII